MLTIHDRGFLSSHYYISSYPTKLTGPVDRNKPVRKFMQGTKRDTP